MAFVYWIHLPSHTNMLSEGYIGFTSKTVQFRYKQHLTEARRGRKSNLYNAIRKYGDCIVIETLVEGPEDYCLDLERKLRPDVKIGWNAGRGGESTMMGYSHSDETRQRMSAASPVKGKTLDAELIRRRAEARKALNLKHSEQVRKKLSDARIRLGLKPWQNPAANPSKWASASTIKLLVDAGDRNCEILRKFSLPPKDCSLCKIIKYIRSGWNPSEDFAYLSWLEEYKIKEALNAKSA